jgi:hypothetical protein
MSGVAHPEQKSDEMTHSALVPLLGRDFDRFLFASVGEERNGMALSVLSALARLDLDPWDEAVALSRMPKDRAKERLVALMAATIRRLGADPSPETVAARLVALLPGTMNLNAPNSQQGAKILAGRPSRFVMAVGLIASAVVGYLMFAAHRSPEADIGPPATTNGAALPH